MPRVKTLKGEIGTSGRIEEVTVGDDAAAAIATAVELEHECDYAGCDIARALDDGYPIWAADLLMGATETPLLDTVVSFYCTQGFNFGAQADADRVAWLASDTWTEHAYECGACGSITFGDDCWTPEQCANCLAELDGRLALASTESD